MIRDKLYFIYNHVSRQLKFVNYSKLYNVKITVVNHFTFMLI